MTDPNLNALWCRALAEELRRAGIAHVVLCPGSRNSPLLFALHATFPDAWTSCVDERTAGFVALGRIKAGDRVVAVCVTSGSAVANLAPAVVEAHAAGLRLVVISADRPWELHDCGAPQTMAQTGLLREHLCKLITLGEPTATDATLRALRSRVSRAVQALTGPVQFNVPLRDPLPPLPDPHWQPPQLARDAEHGRSDGQPFTEVVVSSDPQPVQLPAWLRPGLRGLIVVGCHDDPLVLDAVVPLATATGFPVLADAASGARHPAVPTCITLGDVLVTGPCADAHPDMIIQIGPLPLARTVQEWLAQLDVPWISCEAGPNHDTLARAWLKVDCEQGLVAIGKACASGDPAWSARWQDAERNAQQRWTVACEELPWSEHAVCAHALSHPGFAFVHLASSMAVRYGNLHLRTHDRPIHANRGVNGIDGTIATFLGELARYQRPGLLLIGDLATLHDVGSLFHRPPFRHGAIVIIDNGGGGIFDFLPVHAVPHYEAVVRTPRACDLTGVAASTACRHHRADNVADLTVALQIAAQEPALHLIYCALTRQGAVNVHRLLITSVLGS